MLGLKQKIHFTFDHWSSPNDCSFLGVVAYWLDSDHNLKSTVLGVRRFRGPHTGENQAKHFWDIITPYNIAQKIGYFTLDNASNNDTALQHISSYLTAINIPFNSIQRRLRCFGHILNLVVKAFLWGEDPATFDSEINTYQELNKEAEELEAWRRKGPLGKLHNILVWITRTPQRREKFEAKVKQLLPGSKALTLIRGNLTSWSGDYLSLTRAFTLPEPIEDFVSSAMRHNESGEKDDLPQALKYDELPPADWDILLDIMDLLQPFHKWQICLQKRDHYGQMHEIFPAMDELRLLGHLEESKTLYQHMSRQHDTKHIRTSINTA